MEFTWLRGQNFLWQNTIETIDTEFASRGYRNKTVQILVCRNISLSIFLLFFTSRFLDWNRLVNIVPRFQRLGNGIKGKLAPSLQETLVLTELQKSVFPEALERLRSPRTVPKTNRLYQLDPIIPHGLLC